MLVSAFSDFNLDDHEALQRYLEAHNRTHTLYNRVAVVSGGQDLLGDVNGDWMARHWSRTVALATLAGIDLSSADTKALALPARWRTQQELHDFMEADSRFHMKVDRQLKL